jgi:hypothetical protein
MTPVKEYIHVHKVSMMREIKRRENEVKEKKLQEEEKMEERRNR